MVSTLRFAVHNSAAGQSRNDTQLVYRGLTRKPMKFFWEDAMSVLSRSHRGEGSRPRDFSSSPCCRVVPRAGGEACWLSACLRHVINAYAFGAPILPLVKAPQTLSLLTFLAQHWYEVWNSARAGLLAAISRLLRTAIVISRLAESLC